MITIVVLVCVGKVGQQVLPLKLLFRIKSMHHDVSAGVPRLETVCHHLNVRVVDVSVI